MTTRTSVPPAPPRWPGVSLAILFVGLIGVFATLNGTRSPGPLAGTLESPDAVALSVIEAMAAEDVDRLEGLALTEEEFREHVWPYLPASRPEVNMPFDFLWGSV